MMYKFLIFPDFINLLRAHASTGVASALNICVLVSLKSLDYIQLLESESFWIFIIHCVNLYVIDWFERFQ